MAKKSAPKKKAAPGAANAPARRTNGPAKKPAAAPAATEAPGKKPAGKKIKASKNAAAYQHASPKSALPTPASASNSEYFVLISAAKVSIVKSKPNGGAAAAVCRSFEEAKSAAIDALIDAIEQAERQLTACKQAKSIDALASD
ncbi:MAG: hypothetical protein AB7O59_02820 [Pirellulales bacterium]